MDEVLKKLAARKGEDVTSFAVKEVVGEYDFVAKQLYQMKDVSAMMLEAAEEYQNNRKIQETLDKMYGEGAAIFIGRGRFLRREGWSRKPPHCQNNHFLAIGCPLKQQIVSSNHSLYQSPTLYLFGGCGGHINGIILDIDHHAAVSPLPFAPST